ncbi:DUF2795 domain-containing protein [Nonomuraea maritima]|uniref:DUF2795 domain-containing protein n=1 Tax=Nonomuraea maritima TaxID=683260 RepID=UPI00371A6DA3
MKNEPRVTVVVATRDRRRTLARTLPRHPRPAILVDNGSTDGTPAFVRRHFPGIEVVEAGENLGAPARNIGVSMARTPYVAFADDDSWWADGALDRAADVLDAHPRLALLGARVLVGPEQRLDAVSAQMRDSPLGVRPGLPGPGVLGFLACGAVVRRDAFLEAGGFDDVIFFFGEEERLAVDLAAGGWGLAYVDDVVAHHHPSPPRDPRGRQVLAARNAVLTAVLRRPWPVVARRALDALRQGPAGWEGLRTAVPRLHRALARRRVLPDAVERARRVLERAGREPAGRYAPADVGSEGGMSTAPNPIDLQKHLGGVDYPASKEDLVQAARDHNASNDIVQALEAMPDREYDGPNAVSEAVTKR